MSLYEPEQPVELTDPRQTPAAAQASTGYTPQAPISGLAIASFACAVFSAVGGSIFAAIPAIITGHMAVNRIKRGGQSGLGFAVTGLALGYAMMLISVLVLLFVWAISANIKG